MFVTDVLTPIGRCGKFRIDPHSVYKQVGPPRARKPDSRGVMLLRMPLADSSAAAARRDVGATRWSIYTFASMGPLDAAILPLACVDCAVFGPCAALAHF